MHPIPEADWKFLRSVKDELLTELCKMINDEVPLIIRNTSLSQHEKFLTLYQHVMNKNDVIADCFDDWRRSTIFDKLLMLQKHQLLTDSYKSRLSTETQQRLKDIF